VLYVARVISSRLWRGHFSRKLSQVALS